jgi:hypothetical protein
VASALTYHRVGYEFLSNIIRATGDANCDSFVNVETEEQAVKAVGAHTFTKEGEKF